ncbi:MAG: ribosome biogenesis GTPase Der [Bacilli bacterium]|nr:ribosome biogenesis GTPase Der [Bacilli bacterium]
MKLPTVALVGRPNVGKSTIFNRLVGRRVSIIEDIPGITRDRIYGQASYLDYRFNVIDTGGIDISKDLFNDEIKVQTEIAIAEADLVIFIVDGKEGLTINDYAVKDMLKKAHKKVIVAINKVDNKQAEANKYDFYELGFTNYVFVSGEHNIGIGKLCDMIISHFSKQDYNDYDETIIKFCVVGRPNVGKSSLINALLNEQRVIVSDQAGTTRDAVDVMFTYQKNRFVAIDTAGIRKRNKIWERIEKYSVLRAMKAIDRSDICLVVIDASVGIMDQDKHIAGYIKEAGKGIIIVVNKWDLATQTKKDFQTQIRNQFPFVAYAPMVFLSAITKKELHTLMPEIIKVGDNIKREIKTSLINDVITDAFMLNAPPSYKGRRLKIYFVHQSGIKPPKFTLNVNDKKLVHFSYHRYLENKIRENFNFVGTPIILQFKNKRDE